MDKMGVPSALLPLVILTELEALLLILVGWQTRIVSILLAGSPSGRRAFPSQGRRCRKHDPLLEERGDFRRVPDAVRQRRGRLVGRRPRRREELGFANRRPQRGQRFGRIDVERGGFIVRRDLPHLQAGPHQELARPFVAGKPHVGEQRPRQPYGIAAPPSTTGATASASGCAENSAISRRHSAASTRGMSPSGASAPALDAGKAATPAITDDAIPSA